MSGLTATNRTGRRDFLCSSTSSFSAVDAKVRGEEMKGAHGGESSKDYLPDFSGPIDQSFTMDLSVTNNAALGCFNLLSIESTLYPLLNGKTHKEGTTFSSWISSGISRILPAVPC